MCIGTVVVPQNYMEFTEMSEVRAMNIFPSRCLRMFTFAMIGIDTHLEQSIEVGSLDFNQLWLSNYMKAKPMEEDETGITAFFRVARRTETLQQQFFDTNKYQFQLESGGRATHLVQQVVYGAEFIVCISKKIDLKTDSKNDIEDSFYKACRTFFDNAAKSNWTATDPPTQLENVSCSLMSSLQGGQAIKSSLRHVVECLGYATKCTGDTKWLPVEISLFHIPSQLETRLQLEKITVKKRELYLNLSLISIRIRVLLNEPTLQKIPPFKKILTPFIVLLKSFGRKIAEFHAQHQAVFTVPHVVLREQQPIKIFLGNAINWLSNIHEQVQSLYPILKNSQLLMMDLAEIEALTFPTNVEEVKVFVLTVDYRPDQVMENLHKFIHNNSSSQFRHPIFVAASAGTEYIKDIADKLVAFTTEAKSNLKTANLIGLVPPGSPLKEGAVKVYCTAAKKTTPLPGSTLPSAPPPLIPIFPTSSESSEEQVEVLYHGPPIKNICTIDIS